MANTLLTISKITNKSLMVLENDLALANACNKDYNDEFAVTGAKIGSTVNVRRPGRFIGTSGPALGIEDFNETYVPVTLNTQFHVDTQFNTQDLALSLDAFSERVINPAVAAIANKIDYDGHVVVKNNTANIVGVAGTPPNNLLTFLNAGAYLTSEGAPRDGRRSMIIEPFTGAAIVDSLKGLFTPGAIGEQYQKGVMGKDAGGMNWYEDQNVISHQYGAWAAASAGTLTANTTTNAGFLATGWASTSTIIFTNSATIALKKGDTFTLAGVYAVNPQNRQAYGSNKLRNFVVTADCGGTGSTTFNVICSPAIITGGQFQNVTFGSTATSTTAAVNLFAPGLSASGIVSPQNIMLHKNAFTLASADLEIPEGVHFAGRASDKDVGLSIRIVRQYTINNDSIPARFDVLYGWAALYPELACRVAA